MIIVGLFGFALTVLAGFFAGAGRGTRIPTILIVGCLCLHVIGSLSYWQYSLVFGADSHLYYSDFMKYSEGKFRPGTAFVVMTVQAIKSIFGGYYWEYFVLFQSFGAMGIAFLIRSYSEALADLRQTPFFWEKAVLFLPGLHFWTSAVGKDAPMFLAICMTVWGMMHPARRFPALIAAIFLMALIRPHIAGAAVVAISLALMFDARIGLRLRLPLLALAITAAVTILASVRQELNIETLNASNIADFVASRMEYGSRELQGAQLTSLPFPLKVLSLLFRPFFFDAQGAMGLIVSLENIAFVAIFGMLLFRARVLLRAAISVTYIRFCLILGVSIIIMLAVVNYNVGLGLRQKYMAMPAVLMLFMTLMAYRRALNSALSTE